MTMPLTPNTLRLDLKCGKSGISQGEKCYKGTPTQKALTAGAVGLGVGALALGAVAMSRRAPRKLGSPKPGTPPSSAGLTTSPRPPSSPAGPRPKSKTQRMRENTAAAVQGAERAMGRAAQAEITRAGAVANAMASAGEATGMAAKTTLRELRLRTEAARRRFEPGYRAAPAAQRRAPAQLPEGGSAFAVPFTPETAQPPAREAAPLDPRTGQPRRRRARGFGRSDSPWAVGFDAEDGKKYTKTVTNPETGRKNKVRYGAKGYTIAPGTDKGDRYCARSFGDMKSHGKDCSGPDRNTPLCLSRAKWKCSGKSSRGDAALTPGKSSAW